MNRSEPVEEWVLEDLSIITGRDIRELRKIKAKPRDPKLCPKLNKHRYYRRPGKRHNNDFCSSCSEEGSLICCDGCPHSFHLICLDPPMDEDEIPDGEWFCTKCRVSKKIGPDIKKRFPHRFKQPSKKKQKALISESRRVLGIRTAFNKLIKDVIESNPIEYHNPDDINICPYKFPGEKKDPKELKKKPIALLRCCICKRSPNYQTMVKCDYCENAFHLDCTEPPLTYPPRTYWMCHFHLEPLVENIIFKDATPSLSQRLAVWDFCQSPIDEEAIKLEFFRNIARDRTPMPALPTVPTEIPEAVCQQYDFPPHQMPSLRAALRVAQYEQSLECIKKLSNLAQYVDQKKLATGRLPVPLTAEQELWLSTVVEFQNDAASALLSSRSMQETSSTDDDTAAAADVSAAPDVSAAADAAPDVPEMPVDVPEIFSDTDEDNPAEGSSQDQEETVQDNPETSASKICVGEAVFGGKLDELVVHDKEIFRKQAIERLLNYLVELTPDIHSLDNVDPAVVKLLAFQRIAQLKMQKESIAKATEENQCYNEIVSDVEERTSRLRDITRRAIQASSESIKSVPDSPDNDPIPSTSAGPSVRSKRKQAYPSKKLNFKSNDIYFDIRAEDFQKFVEDELSSLSNSSQNRVKYSEIVRTNKANSLVDNNDSTQDTHTYPTEDPTIPITSPAVSESLNTEQPQSDDVLRSTEEPSPQLHASNRQEPPLQSQSERVEAVLYNIQTKRIFPIKKGHSVVGKGPDCDVDLSLCGPCRLITDHQCDIFYDKVACRWEVLNFNSLGSKVENLFVSLHHNKRYGIPEETKGCCAVENAREIIRAHIAHKDMSSVRKARLESFSSPPPSSDVGVPCTCQKGTLFDQLQYSGHVGSLILRHGSTLEFGCKEFIFCITNTVE